MKKEANREGMDAAPTREERVAGLVRALETSREMMSSYHEIPAEAWLLTNTEALAGLEWGYDRHHEVSACSECEVWKGEPHLDDCVTGTASEAWRRFTAKGEHGGT